ncbi:MAG: endonuclease domain-containing protein [Gemmatimonadales bacterium]
MRGRHRRRTALGRQLRQEATPAERGAWNILRARRMMNLTFRRQHPLGPFVVDFYCAEHRLVIELDGPVHDAEVQRDYDAARDAYLVAGNYHIIRLKNEQATEVQLRDAIAGVLGVPE